MDDISRATDPAVAAARTKSALSGFERVLRIEDERGSKSPFYFEALCAIVQLLAAKAAETESHAELVGRLEALLRVTDLVTRNQWEGAVLNLIESVSRPGLDGSLAAEVSKLISRYLAKDVRFLLKAFVKLGQAYLAAKNWARLAETCKHLDELLAGDASLDKADVIALQLQMCVAQNDVEAGLVIVKRLVATSGGDSQMQHPRTQGVLQHYSGILYLKRDSLLLAQTAFFNALLSYDSASDRRVKDALKLYIVTSMLLTSTVSIFSSYQAIVYKDDPEVVPLTELYAAFASSDLSEFERVLVKHRRLIDGDELISAQVPRLLHIVRTAVLREFLRPYVCVGLSHVARVLRCSAGEAEDVLMNLILDGSIDGHIDQVGDKLVLAGAAHKHKPMLDALGSWTTQLQRVTASLEAKLS